MPPNRIGPERHNEVMKAGVGALDAQRHEIGVGMALYDGLMVQWIIDPSLVDWDAITETIKNTLVAGLLTDKSK